MRKLLAILNFYCKSNLVIIAEEDVWYDVPSFLLIVVASVRYFSPVIILPDSSSIFELEASVSLSFAIK